MKTDLIQSLTIYIAYKSGKASPEESHDVSRQK